MGSRCPCARGSSSATLQSPAIRHTMPATTREDSIVRKITVRAFAALAAATLALGLAPGVAQAQPREVVIGPVTHCSVITFFDYVIFEFDCNYGA